jgi:3-deoxy-D-manno-octulosonate 8-phosphate phosphatase (KDO 8-P phosphatase)
MTTRAQAGRPLPDLTVLRGIEMLLLDVDGVLTDGRIHFDGEGREFKSFHVHDAAGLVYWRRSGKRAGFLSGRGGEVVAARGRELKLDEVVLERHDKGAAFGEILARQGLSPRQVAYCGDDLLDLPVLREVGLACTVPEARAEVAAIAQFVTTRSGGFGAARDIVELLMRAQGTWAAVVQKDGLP